MPHHWGEKGALLKECIIHPYDQVAMWQCVFAAPRVFCGATLDPNESDSETVSERRCDNVILLKLQFLSIPNSNRKNFVGHVWRCAMGDIGQYKQYLLHKIEILGHVDYKQFLKTPQRCLRGRAFRSRGCILLSCLIGTNSR